jgi:hypothetical protein
MIEYRSQRGQGVIYGLGFQAFAYSFLLESLDLMLCNVAQHLRLGKINELSPEDSLSSNGRWALVILGPAEILLPKYFNGRVFSLYDKLPVCQIALNVLFEFEGLSAAGRCERTTNPLPVLVEFYVINAVSTIKTCHFVAFPLQELSAYKRRKRLFAALILTQFGPHCQEGKEKAQRPTYCKSLRWIDL